VIAEVSNTTANSDLSSFSTFDVDVGSRGGLLFSPNYIDASIGDVINFRFLKLNHTLTQSSFDQPCVPNGGFDTGFSQFNPTNKTNKAFTMVVEKATPMWFFCHQTLPVSHCARGMVFAINPGVKMDQFLDNAQQQRNVANSTGYSSSATTGSHSNSAQKNCSQIPTPATTAPGVFFTDLSASGMTGSNPNSNEKISPATGTGWSHTEGTGLLGPQISTPMTTAPGVYFTGVPTASSILCTCISSQSSKNLTNAQVIAFSMANSKISPHKSLLVGMVLFFFLTAFSF
jgi:hypothetical protein